MRAGAIAALALAASAMNPYRMLLRARLALGRYLGLVAAQALLGVALLAVVVRAGGGLVAVFAALATAALGGLVLGRVLVGGGVGSRPDATLARELLRDAWPLAGTTAALTAAQQVVTLVLLAAHGAAAVGLLGGAQRLVDAIALVPQALMVSVLPALSMAAARPDTATARAREAARVLAVIIVPVVAALVLWAEPVLVHAFGASFAAGAPTLRWLARLRSSARPGPSRRTSSSRSACSASCSASRSWRRRSWSRPACTWCPPPARRARPPCSSDVARRPARARRASGHPAPRRAGAGAAARPAGVAVVAAWTAMWAGPSLPAAAGFLAAYVALLLATRTVTAADLARWRG